MMAYIKQKQKILEFTLFLTAYSLLSLFFSSIYFSISFPAILPFKFFPVL